MTDRVSDWWLWTIAVIAAALTLAIVGCFGVDRGAQQGALNQKADAKTESTTSQNAGRDATNTTKTSADNSLAKVDVSNAKILADMKIMNGNRAFDAKEIKRAVQSFGMSGWEVGMIVLASGLIARIDDVLKIVWRRIRRVKP